MNITRDDAASRQRGAVRSAVLAAGLCVAAILPADAAEGIASFYGRREHGGPTASGERFNMHAMTAAHRTAPLGSHLRVTNLKNGRSIVVRINDRGPFVKGRIIDLSHAAAERLGFVGSGLTRVAVEPASAGALAENDAPATTGAIAAKATPVAPAPVAATPVAATPVAATETAEPKAAPHKGARKDETRVAADERDTFLIGRNGTTTN